MDAMSNLIQIWRDAMRMLRRERKPSSATHTSWCDRRADPATGGGDSMDGDVGQHQHRIAELLAGNEDQALELWSAKIAIRVLAEKIVELEEQR